MKTCEACSTGTMRGPIPGILSNGERCDTCERYASDRDAKQAMNLVESLAAMMVRVHQMMQKLPNCEVSPYTWEEYLHAEALLAEIMCCDPEDLNTAALRNITQNDE